MEDSRKITEQLLSSSDSGVLPVQKDTEGVSGAAAVVSITISGSTAQNMYATANNTTNHIHNYNISMASTIEKNSLISMPWNLPRKNPWFVERPDLIRTLENFFSISSKELLHYTLITYGMGGTGKTELAVYFLHSSPEKYTERYWFQGGNEEVLANQYAVLYRKLLANKRLREENPVEETEAMVLIVKKWLEKNPGWLLVYDNVEDENKLRRFLPEKGGHILITARYKSLSAVNKLRIYEMKLEEGKDVIRKIVKSEGVFDLDEQDLNNLVVELGRLPLALAQAGAYMAKNSVSAKEYLVLYRKAKDYFLADKSFSELHERYSKSVAITWNVTFDKIKEHQILLDILIFCCYLDPDNISASMIFSYLQSKNSEYDPKEFLRDMGVLRSHDMIKYDIINITNDDKNEVLIQSKSQIRIHRLVQDVLRIQYKSEEEKILLSLSGFFGGWFEVHKKNYEKMLNLSVHMNFLIKNRLRLDGKNEETINAIGSVVSGLQVCLYGERGSVNVDNNLDISQAGVDKKGPMNLGLVLTEAFIGFEWFHVVLMKTLKNIFDESTSPSSWDKLTRINLYFSYRFRSEAKIMYKSVESSLKRLGQDKNADAISVCIVKAYLSALQRGERKNKESRDLARESIPKLVEKYGKDNQFLALSYLDWGCVARELGDYQESFDCIKKSFEIFQSKIPNDRITFLAMLELSITLNRLNKISESKKLYDQSFGVIEKIYQPFFSNNQNTWKLLKMKLENYHTGIDLCYCLSKSNYADEITETIFSAVGSTKKHAVKKISLFFYLLKLLNRFYQSLPFNFSSITGWRYPMLPRLTGGILGRMSLLKSVDLFEDIKTTGRMAMSHPRNMSYFWLGNTLGLFIIKPSDIKQVLKHYHNNVSRKKPFENFSKLLGGEDNILLAMGEEANHYRTYLRRQIFVEGALKKFVLTTQTILSKKLSDSDGKFINLRDFFNSLTMNVFSQCCLGTKDISDEAVSEISDCISTCLKESIDIKGILKYLNSNSVEEASSKLKEAFKKHLLRPHKQNILESSNIIKDILVEEYGKGILGFENIKSIYSKGSTLLLAGHETTSITFQFVIRVLSYHEDIVLKLREELRENFSDKEISFESIKDLHYLRAIIKEILRLYPPATFIARGVDTPFDIIDMGVDSDDMKQEKYQEFKNDPKRDKGNDIRVYKGDIIFISTFFTQRLESLWPEPEKFDPERHYDSNGEVSEFKLDPLIGEGEYVAFGLGDRSCIGWKFAVQELMLCLAVIYSNYEVKLDDSSALKEEDLHWAGTLRLRKSIQAQFVPLNSLKSDKRSTNSNQEVIGLQTVSKSEEINTMFSHEESAIDVFKKYTENEGNWESIKSRYLEKYLDGKKDAGERQEALKALVKFRDLIDFRLYRQSVEAIFPGYRLDARVNGEIKHDKDGLPGFVTAWYEFIVMPGLTLPQGEKESPRCIIRINAPGSRNLTSDIDTSIVTRIEGDKSAFVVHAQRVKERGPDYEGRITNAIIDNFYTFSEKEFSLTSGEHRDSNVYVDLQDDYPKFRDDEARNPAINGSRLFKAEELVKKLAEWKLQKHRLELAASLFSLRTALGERGWIDFKNQAETIVKESAEHLGFSNGGDQKREGYKKTTLEDLAEVFKQTEVFFEIYNQRLSGKKLELASAHKSRTSALSVDAQEKDLEVAALNRLYVETLEEMTGLSGDILNLREANKTLLREVESLGKTLDEEAKRLKMYRSSAENAELFKKQIEEGDRRYASLDQDYQSKLGNLRDNYLKIAAQEIKKLKVRYQSHTFANEAYVCRSAVYHVVTGNQQKGQVDISEQTLLGSALQQIGFKLLHTEDLKKRRKPLEEVAYRTSKYGHRIHQLLFKGEVSDKEIQLAIKLGNKLGIFSRLKSEEIKKTVLSLFKAEELLCLNVEANIISHVKNNRDIPDKEKYAKTAELLEKSPEQSNELFLSLACKILAGVYLSKFEQNHSLLWGGFESKDKPLQITYLLEKAKKSAREEKHADNLPMASTSVGESSRSAQQQKGEVFIDASKSHAAGNLSATVNANSQSGARIDASHSTSGKDINLTANNTGGTFAPPF